MSERVEVTLASVIEKVNEWVQNPDGRPCPPYRKWFAIGYREGTYESLQAVQHLLEELRDAIIARRDAYLADEREMDAMDMSIAAAMARRLAKELSGFLGPAAAQQPGQEEAK